MPHLEENCLWHQKTWALQYAAQTGNKCGRIWVFKSWPLYINPNHSCAKRGLSRNTEELLHDGKMNGELQVRTWTADKGLCPWQMKVLNYSPSQVQATTVTVLSTPIFRNSSKNFRPQNYHRFIVLEIIIIIYLGFTKSERRLFKETIINTSFSENYFQFSKVHF